MRVVSVFADDQAYTVRTASATVGNVLSELSIDVGSNDLVEPGIETAIIDTVFNINVYRARPVTIVDGDETYRVMSPYQSPRLIAESADIAVYDEDTFSLERINNILDLGSIGQRLVINRATPVTVSLYGTEFVHRTHSATVQDVLNERSIRLDEADTVSPAADTELVAGQTIEITHVGTEVAISEEPVPFETQQIFDNDRLQGIREVTQVGQVGSKVITYEVELHNGVEVARTPLQTVVSQEPTPEIVIVGTKVPDTNTNVLLGQQMAAARGWGDGEFQCLYRLWMQESRWNHVAENPSSGAYGIPQSLPGRKMASHGDDWQTNPATQIAWGLDYIANRYGTPCVADTFQKNNNWY